MNADGDRGETMGPGLPSVTQAEELDRACDRFEAAWRAGERPRIEDHLEGIAEPLRPALAGELIAVELHWRRRRGERPAPAEYRDRFPAHVPGVESSSTVADTGGVTCLPPSRAEATIETGSLGPGARQDPERATLPADAIAVGGPSADLQAATAASDTPAPVATRGSPVIPGYTIEGELGRGAMGVVYKAKHLRLNRVVAIKMISLGSFPTEHGVRRFQAEAELAAALDHPGIVAVYEIGDYGGWPFFAMRLVEGGAWPSTSPDCWPTGARRFACWPRWRARSITPISTESCTVI